MEGQPAARRPPRFQLEAAGMVREAQSTEFGSIPGASCALFMLYGQPFMITRTPAAPHRLARRRCRSRLPVPSGQPGRQRHPGACQSLVDASHQQKCPTFKSPRWKGGGENLCTGTSQSAAAHLKLCSPLQGRQPPPEPPWTALLQWKTLACRPQSLVRSRARPCPTQA